MGCDIHCHVEVLIEGKWEHWSAPHVVRNYEFFGRLAGVRGRCASPVAKDRGLPLGLSRLTQMAYDMAKECYQPHNEGWVTGSELEELLESWARTHEDYRVADAPRAAFGYLFGNGFEKHEGDDIWPAEVEDVRCVFWFDN